MGMIKAHMNDFVWPRLAPSRDCYNPSVKRLFSGLVVGLCLLVACAPAQPGPTTPVAPGVATATATMPAGLAVAANSAITFVDAINRRDFVVAHALFDGRAMADTPTVALLQAAYDEALRDGRTLTITAQLRGGLIPEGVEGASAALVSVWQSPLLGAFEVTTTLQLALESGAWRVRWSRNAVAPGFADGKLLIELRRLERASVFASDGTLLSGPSQRTTLGVQRSLIKNADDERAMLAVLARLTGFDGEAIRRK